MVDSNNADILLLQNKAWSAQVRAKDPTFFELLSKSQSPKFLWIGCSDSRVPADAITGTRPGQIFVHRNIANLVVHSDLNLACVIQYAVEVLEVEHIIVCGHHGCGGVRAAMTPKDFGMLNKWLRNIKDVYSDNLDELTAIEDPRKREDRLVELTVIRQTYNLMKMSTIQQAWKKRGGPWLHAWVYDLSDGILHELKNVAPGTPVPAPFLYE
jgi:carbonic anhydrase